MRDIRQLVRDALSNEESRDFVEVYVNEVLTSLRDSQSQVRRTLLLLFLTMFLFELLTRAAVQEVSIGAFKLSDYSLLYKLLPLAIAYLYYELISLFAMIRLASDALRSSLEIINPEIVSKDLEFFMAPHSSFNVANFLFRTAGPSRTSRVAGWILRNLHLPVFLALFLGAVVFEVYAFSRLFLEFGPASIIVWVALITSLTFLLLGVATFIEYQALYAASFRWVSLELNPPTPIADSSPFKPTPQCRGFFDPRPIYTAPINGNNETKRLCS